MSTPTPTRKSVPGAGSGAAETMSFAEMNAVVHEAKDKILALIAERDALLEAVNGDDPEMPIAIRPIGWLHTMIEECKRHAVEDKSIEDIDSYYEMIGEVESLYNKAKAAIAASSHDIRQAGES